MKIGRLAVDDGAVACYCFRMDAEVVDLFCGVGGLSMGFRAEGFRVVAGIDVDETCRYAYEANTQARFRSCDITELSSGDIEAFFSKGRKVLVGCTPGQPFSIYTGRYRKNSDDAGDIDRRWRLLEQFARVIEDVEPDVVSMENVPRVVLHPVFERFVGRLRRKGYEVTQYRVRADYYGVPQKRARLVMFASRHGPVALVQPTHKHRPITVRETIGCLPPITAGTAHAEDPLHTSRGLTDRNLGRLRATSEGGSWRDWDPAMQLDCHKRSSGISFKSVYGRMNWDEPSPVITTQCLGIGNGRFGHPEQDRAISIREASLLQSFPPDFKFVRPGERPNGCRLARQIGNAVPPRLASVVAKSIRLHIQSIDETAVAA